MNACCDRRVERGRKGEEEEKEEGKKRGGGGVFSHNFDFDSSRALRC